jgi:hypothetical protein
MPNDSAQFALDHKSSNPANATTVLFSVVLGHPLRVPDIDGQGDFPIFRKIFENFTHKKTRRTMVKRKNT